MSFVRSILNRWLRLTEKPYLQKVEEPRDIRRSFESKARLFFHAPRGTRFDRASIDDIACLWVTPPGRVAADAPILLYLHGGAFIFGSPNTHKAMIARLVSECGAQACLPNYRKAPEHPFPAALEDAMAVYRALLSRNRQIILGGDSAGGGLALAMLGEICAKGLPQPAGCFALSPVTDQTFSGASFRDNAEADVILPAGRAKDMSEMYLQGHDPEDPRASPLFGRFAGAGPVWLAAGDTEILLDDVTRMAQRLREDGVEVKEVIETDLPHVWPIFHNILPEARVTLATLASWIKSLASQ